MLRQYDIPSVEPTPQDSRYYAPFISEESESRDKANVAMARYLEAYLSFAVAVIGEISREMPEERQRYLRVATVAARELSALRSNLQVKTLEEARQVEAVVDGLLSYIAAAEYLEDKATMLGHAMGEMKATLKMLDLVRPSASSAVWAQTAQSTEQVGRNKVEMPEKPKCLMSVA